ncbi:N-6 DNA methylase [Streptomonospora nanhaiensis]|uniref:N-6 DNA methylase n=1 Tax=Streptomonospora nanhaiensis TaxID=1323731 RepID=UPI003D36ACD8
MRKNEVRIGEVFDRFRSLAGERMGRAGGEFFTPRSVNELIVRRADLRLGMLVGDFYAGVGGTLVTALARVGAPALETFLRGPGRVSARPGQGADPDPAESARAHRSCLG